MKRERVTERKPLFVPLTTKWFRQFESGEKYVEYRAFGPRWNLDTCFGGREVTLSHGYSGARLSSKIVSVDVLHAAAAPEVARQIFPNAEKIIAIHLGEITPAGRRALSGDSDEG